jgi:lauroyl/myristoyl acyltransferase
MSEKVPPLIVAKDLLEIVRIPFLAVISWMVPERHWDFIARGFASLGALMQIGQTRSRELRHKRRFGDRIAHSSSSTLETAASAHYLVARMQGFGDYRPGGWRPEIEVNGTDHIEAALEKGHGAVLWVTPFIYSDLLTKIGLHKAGYRVSHLTRPRHGFTRSMFGIRVLNPIWTRIEDRYLAERVRIGDTSLPGSALDTLRDRLSENQVVSITVGWRAHKTAQVAFMGGKLRLATGPVHLARTSEAALLPVFSVRTETGKFAINIESSLIQSTDGNADGSYQAIVQQYAKMLERYMLEYPSQWGKSWVRKVRCLPLAHN